MPELNRLAGLDGLFDSGIYGSLIFSARSASGRTIATSKSSILAFNDVSMIVHSPHDTDDEFICDAHILTPRIVDHVHGGVMSSAFTACRDLILNSDLGDSSPVLDDVVTHGWERICPGRHPRDIEDTGSDLLQ